ncbi:hypothetical protein [Flavobacterium marginilacus]|uniref:hypothetical protein n=1 Tax=Flavobacterium marginilacus TaxID=3003256 RepID=UPI00248F3AF6|nr:hypothetical protein [Flavobacterium marginilacus]
MKKVIKRAIDKDIITQDPFRAFKCKMTKLSKGHSPRVNCAHSNRSVLQPQDSKRFEISSSFSAILAWLILMLTNFGRQI